MEEKTKLILTKVTNELEKRVRALLNICESPIEEYFLINIIQYFYLQSLMSLDFKFLTNWVDDPFAISSNKSEKFNYKEENIDVFGWIYGIKVTPTKDTSYKIIPQYEFNNFRMDFAILIEKPDSITKICIECDGFEFHKTKEQLKRDNQRSRDMAGHGWTTLRYTGSELFNWDNQSASDFEIMLLNFLKNQK